MPLDAVQKTTVIGIAKARFVKLVVAKYCSHYDMAMPTDEEIYAAIDAIEEIEDAWHVNIGRFIAEYSKLDHRLKWNLAKLIDVKRDDFEIVIGWWDFARTCEQFRLVLERNLAAKPEKLPHARWVISEALKVNDNRVIIVHGLWSHTARGDLHVLRTPRGKSITKGHFEEIKALVEATEQARLVNAVLAFDPELGGTPLPDQIVQGGANL